MSVIERWSARGRVRYGRFHCISFGGMWKNILRVITIYTYQGNFTGSGGGLRELESYPGSALHAYSYNNIPVVSAAAHS